MVTITYSKEIALEGMGPPSGMCINKDTILLSDELNHRLNFFDLNSGESSFFGKEGNGPGEFRYPKGVCIDSDGCFYVADCWNHRVQKFSPDRTPLFSVGKYGDAPEEFNEPFSLTLTSNNQLLVVDRCNHRIQFLDRDGNFHGYVGQRGTIFEEELAELYQTPLHLFSAPAFEFPNDLALDSRGNIYVVDSNNHRIVKLSPSGKLLYSFGEKGSASSQFRFPYGISIDSNDLLLVSDMNNERVQVFTSQGEIINSFSGDTKKKVECPTNIAVSNSREIFLTNGLAPNIKKFEYESLPIADFFSNETNRGSTKGNSTTLGLFLLESGKKASDFQSFKKHLLSVKSEDLCKTQQNCSLSFSYLTKEMIQKELFEPEEAKALLLSLMEVIDYYHEAVIAHLKSRLQKGKEIVLRQLRFDEASMQKQEAFDTELIRLLREERISFDETRLTLLKYKRVVQLTRSLADKYIDRNCEGGADFTSLVAKNSSSLLQKMLFFLEEREFFESEREKHFKDESRSQKDNWADFKYFSWCFDVIDKIVKVYQETTNDYLHRINTVLNETTPLCKKPFTSEMQLQKEKSPLWKTVAKVALLSATDGELDYPSIEEVLKSLISHIFGGESNEPLPENTTTDADPENDILLNVFSILLAESEGIDSQLFKKGCFCNDVRVDMESVLKNIIKELDDVTVQYEKTLTELASAETSAQQAPIKDNSLSIPIYNKLTVKWYGRILILRSFVSIAMKTRLIGCELIERVLTDKADQKENTLRLLNETEKNISLRMQHCLEWTTNHYEILSGTGKYKAGGQPLFLCLAFLAFNKVALPGLQQLLTLLRQVQETVDLSLLEGNENSEPQDIAITSNSNPLKQKNIKRSQSNKTESLCYDQEFGTYGTKLGELNQPTGISIDRDGFIYVVEKGNHRVQIFTKDGKVVSSFGSFGFKEENFNNPSSIAIDDNQELVYIGDAFNNRVQAFTKEGEFIRFLTPHGDKGFKIPGGIAIDQAGVVYVTDNLNHRIVRFTPEGKPLADIGTEGNAPGDFYGPFAISVDAENNIYIGETFNYRVQKLDSNGTSLHCIGKRGTGNDGVIFPNDMELGPNGEIYISDFFNNKIMCINKEFTNIKRISEYGARKGEAVRVSGLSSDSSSLFSCDFYNHRIQRWTFV